MENAIIKGFVEDWKVEALKWAKQTKEDYRAQRTEISELKKIEKFDIYEYFRRLDHWCQLRGVSNLMRKWYDDQYNLDEMYEKEAIRKYKQFMDKIEKAVGEVTEAHLKIGIDSNINGFVIGTKGSASVNTILAGGWNIQCLHYRVLVKKY